MSEYLNSQNVYEKLQRNALGGAKIPHRVSLPVLHKINEDYVIASFIFTFTREHIQKGLLPRPAYWITADMATGDTIKEYDCREYDFSGEPFDKLYNIRSNQDYNLTNEYYDTLYKTFDEVRREFIGTKRINREKYAVYLKMVTATIPPEYQIFFKELSLQ
jgi:hypothetical protein